ncbi:MAG: sulfite exporter TauE/SafE family protein [Dehalococcoidia bacterium]|nr:sulfite exporter TauE/SafE family protein [Dehalococcoidia bacterium]
MLDFLPILVVTGAAVGFTAALLGVGGGFIMVPVMYWVMSGSGLPEGTALLTAFGTSLFVMIPTVLSSTLRHHRLGAVVWRVSIILGPCGLVGALAGSTLAASLPSHALKVGFGIMVLLIALRMGIGFRGTSCEDESCPQPARIRLVILGLGMGVISGLTGLGGGALMVPALVLLFHFPMRRAVATSSAAIIFTSIGGITGYIANGLGVVGRLPYSLGYVNVAVGLSLIVLSIPMAQLGARTAHVVDAKRLRLIFAVLMFYVGLRMMGVFEGLGL